MDKANNGQNKATGPRNSSSLPQLAPSPGFAQTAASATTMRAGPNAEHAGRRNPRKTKLSGWHNNKTAVTNILFILLIIYVTDILLE